MHSQKHPRHATQLPRCHHHVLQTAGIRVWLRQWALPGVHGVLSTDSLLHGGIRLLLGVLATQPPAGLAAPVIAHGPPHASQSLPPHATDSYVAPRLPAQRLPAAPCCIGTSWTEMRLSGGLSELGQGGRVWGFRGGRGEDFLFLVSLN